LPFGCDFLVVLEDRGKVREGRDGVSSFAHTGVGSAKDTLSLILNI